MAATEVPKPTDADIERELNRAFMAVEGRSIDDWAEGLSRPRKTKRRAA